MKIIVTGASGLLGRAVIAHLKHKAHSVRGWAFTRAGVDLDKVDLRDEELVKESIKSFYPDVLVHCAAERRPDVAEKDPKGTEVMNVGVTEYLTKCSNQFGFKMIYICTDYIFDGNAPEGGYDVDAIPNPTNHYGKTKLAGEQAMLKLGQKGKVLSLRVPVLYGKTENNYESAINILIDAVKKTQQGQTVEMDNWATRYPTLVDDVAKVIEQLCVLDKDYPPILNLSSQEKFTKYSISLIFQNLTNSLKNSNDDQTRSKKMSELIIPINDYPINQDSNETTIRPKDCHLNNQYIEKQMNLKCEFVDFLKWWEQHIHLF